MRYAKPPLNKIIFPLVIGFQICILAWMNAYWTWAENYVPDWHEDKRKYIIERAKEELLVSKTKAISKTATWIIWRGSSWAITNDFKTNQGKKWNAIIVSQKWQNSVIQVMKYTTGASVDMPKSGIIQKSIKKECEKKCKENKYWTAYDTAISQIHKWEGLRLKAYWDTKWYSIGYWTRAKSKIEVITQEEADKRVSFIVKSLLWKVQKDFPDLHAKWQWALVSFAFNCSQWYRAVRNGWLKYHQYWCKTVWEERLAWLVNRRSEEEKFIFSKQF